MRKTLLHEQRFLSKFYSYQTIVDAIEEVVHPQSVLQEVISRIGSTAYLDTATARQTAVQAESRARDRLYKTSQRLATR